MDDDYMTWLENGVSNVNWWDLHNSIMPNDNNSPSLYGTTNYGDYGILSSGESANGASEPAADVPFPACFGLQMLNDVGRGGDRMITASSTQGLVSVFAVHQANGKTAVLFINKDPNTIYDVQLSWSGFTPGPNPTAYFYGENSQYITVTHEHGKLPDHIQFLPPYSLTTLVVSPQ